MTDAYTHLAEQSPRAADRFLDEVEALIGLLTEFPSIGRRRARMGRGVRSFRVRRYPYLVFYKAERGGVTLLRLLHGARRIGRKMVGA